MPVARLHRLGFLATLATGVAMLGASVWGLAGVEAQLTAAVEPERPAGPSVTLVADHPRAGDCPGRPRGHDAGRFRDRV
jgi:hypothetical protein